MAGRLARTATGILVSGLSAVETVAGEVGAAKVETRARVEAAVLRYREHLP
jgi:hypothetical protein